MIDLHCHILPGIDDGAADLGVALAMARAFVADGVDLVACTPHILPGLYHNTGPGIRAAVTALDHHLREAGIPLVLTTGADIHIAPDLVAGLGSGHLLSLADTRYVLIEPPHHVVPVRFDETMFNLLVAGFVPIITHPERLTWIRDHYATLRQLAAKGVWMQVTAGSLSGRFGKAAAYWAERMLEEGLVHIIATDAHDTARRPPCLAEGRERASRIVGADEAEHLVHTRPLAILNNLDPADVIEPAGRRAGGVEASRAARRGTAVETQKRNTGHSPGVGGAVRSIGRRLREFLH